MPGLCGNRPVPVPIAALVVPVELFRSEGRIIVGLCGVCPVPVRITVRVAVPVKTDELL